MEDAVPTDELCLNKAIISKPASRQHERCDYIRGARETPEINIVLAMTNANTI